MGGREVLYNEAYQKLFLPIYGAVYESSHLLTTLLDYHFNN